MTDSIEDKLVKIEAEIAQIMPAGISQAWRILTAGESLSPVSTVQLEKIIAPGLALLKRGGKRWRPLLLLLCSELCGSSDRALPLTPLVEVPHNGTLIIDDIEDNARERRGGPAAHLQFGIDTAVNTGNFMYFLPTCLIDQSSLTSEEKLILYRYYLEDMRRLHLGQGLDILWHRDHDYIPGVEEYLQMCRLKTGSMARLAARTGIIAGKGDEALAGEVGKAAEDFGVAFQIIDDIKNLTTGVPGKKRGDDIIEGKKSLPVILYLTRHPEAGTRVKRLFQAARTGRTVRTAGAIEKMIGLLEDSGSITGAQQKAETLTGDAKSRLKKLFPPSPCLIQLLDITDSLINS